MLVVELGIERPGAHIDVSVIVPVFNSEGSLPILIPRVNRALAGRSFEILLVNDGSSDRSWEIIRDWAGRDPSVRGLNLMRNYGQHNALLAGVRAARGDLTVTLDDDLQHPPEEIPILLTELSRGFDVVYGTPATLPHSPFRNIAAWTTKLVLQEAIGAETARKVSAFRAFRTDLRKAFEDYRSPYVSMDVLLTWATSKFSAVAVKHRPREIGKSQYTFRTLARHALTMITSFSTLPLRLASLTGLCFTVLGFGVLVYVLVTYAVRHGSVPGFPFLASIIAIFSGAQLFALGIIGEYLARIHSRMMERPTYAIAEQVGGREDT
jgi:undecaprenyl-phosphate 4-deoxy-4-formamido-L-arabinose transferase